MKKIGFILAILVIVVAALGLRLYRFAPIWPDAHYTDAASALPPGLQLDEGFNDLLALRLLRNGVLAPHFAIDQGIAAAHIYLTALVMQLVGPIAEAGRLASVIAGLLSIPAMAWLAYELFRPRYSTSDRRILQLLAAAQVAGTYWFVTMSRFGLELIVVPLLTLPALAMLWRWLHKPTLKASLLAGGLLGVTLYSYAAAYVLPLVAGLGILVFWLLSKRTEYPAFRQIIAYGAAFALVVFPLAMFALESPDFFGLHLETTAAASSTTLVENLGGTLGGIFLNGDRFASYNLPGRPLLDMFQALFAVLGVITCLRRLKQPEFLFVLLWSAITLLPAIFSAWSPAFNRIAAAVPAIILLVSIGGLEVYRFLARRGKPALGLACLVLAVAFTVSKTAIDYFIIWPTTPGLHFTFSTTERVQAEAIAALPPNTSTYLSPSDASRPMYAFLWQDQPRAKSFNGRRCTVAPRQADRATVWLIASNEDKLSRERLTQLYPQLKSKVLWALEGSRMVNLLSVEPGTTAQIPPTPLGRVGDWMQLRDYQVLEMPAPGGKLRTRLVWESIAPTAHDWTEALHLIDANGQLVAQDDRQPCDNSYSTSIWQPGELVVEDRTLNLPPDLPAGDYTLTVVWYSTSDNARLPVYDSAGQPRGDVFTLGTVTVP